MIDILSNFPKDYKGFCVEAGACDGVHLSRTLELEKLNWNCLCVEPNDHYYENLKRYRRLTSNFALSNVNEDNVPFYIYKYNDMIGEAGLSSLKLNEELKSQTILENVCEFQRQIRVDVRTLDFVLEQFEFPQVDLLILDVEGYELNVLKGFNIKKYKPKLVIVDNPLETEDIRIHMMGHENAGFFRDGFDDVYIF